MFMIVRLFGNLRFGFASGRLTVVSNGWVLGLLAPPRRCSNCQLVQGSSPVPTYRFECSKLFQMALTSLGESLEGYGSSVGGHVRSVGGHGSSVGGHRRLVEGHGILVGGLGR